MQVYFSPIATQDLEDIGDYIALDNPGRAVTFITELATKCHGLSKNPRMYSERPELRKGIRLAPHGKYCIVYSIIQEKIIIVRILHCSRNIAHILGAKGHNYG